MNSFNTDADTRAIVKKYGTSDYPVTLATFNQSKFPRLVKESRLPMPDNAESPITCWYPPGHGDLYRSFDRSGLLDKYIAEGKEYAFISNVDNLGATVDSKILNYMKSSNADFIMEVTDKQPSDIKGGTLIDYEGRVRLLEVGQVSAKNVEDFKSMKKFKIFNTNNLWINLKALKANLNQLNMDVIVNNKIISGKNIVQLETAVGSAINFFPNAIGVNVPRSRFLPVKSTSDLLLVQSNLYTLNNGRLEISARREYPGLPLIKLGDSFKKVADYMSRFENMPDVLECSHLTVSGDVTFGADVVLKGTVIIVANHGSKIDIPSGSILENNVVTGSLRIMAH